MDRQTTPKLYPSDFVGGDNKLGRGPLDDVTYQISRLVVSDKKTFKVFFFLACVT